MLIIIFVLKVNLIITSDQGMAAVNSSRVIVQDEYVPQSNLVFSYSKSQ